LSKRFAKYIDGALLFRVAQGDRDAYAKIYLEYSGTVKETIRQYIANEDDCNDLTQQVFISLWDSRSLLAEVRSFDDYLFITVRNRVFRYFNRLKKEALIVHEMGAGIHIDSPGAHQQVELREYLTLWDRAISMLPPQQQQGYTMIERDELNIAAVAGELGLARGTIKKHLELARRAVRQFIEQHSERGRTAKALLLPFFLFFIF